MKRLRHSSIATLVVASSFAWVPRPASAQTAGFAADRFDPAERGSDWFMGESLDLQGHLRPAVGVTIDWAHDPIELRTANGSDAGSLVSNSVYAHVGGSFVLWERLRVGLNVPIALDQTGNTAVLDGESVTPKTGAAFGDVRLGADVRLFGRYGEAITMAAGVQVYFPTGSRAAFASDGTVRVTPRLLVAGKVGPFVYSAHAGVLVRSSDDLGGTDETSELTFTGTLGLQFLHDRVTVGPEVYGSTTLNRLAFDKNETPLEGLIGGHFRVTDDVRIGAGVSAGLTGGIGNPTSRVVGMFEYAPVYKAPVPPAPPPVVIQCPEGSTLTGGTTCVPNDRDGDGIADLADACPDQPGVASTDPKLNGCPPPPPDRDGDGVPDAVDACPDVRGVATNNPKTNGCPADEDADGIPDTVDACPHDPGPKNEDPKKNGCPKAIFVEKEIRITDQIQFRTGKAEIDPVSDETLRAVLEVLTAHPEVTRLTIEGHTDNRGPAALNLTLSSARAASVLKWLVKNGIERDRLEAHGFGAQRPLVGNDTEEGRRLNRRVEFHAVDSKLPGSPSAGSAKTGEVP